MLATIDSGSCHVLRSTDWLALVNGKDYHALPGSVVIVLPDSATTADVVAVLRTLDAGGAPRPPTGAPPG